MSPHRLARSRAEFVVEGAGQSGGRDLRSRLSKTRAPQAQDSPRVDLRAPYLGRLTRLAGPKLCPPAAQARSGEPLRGPLWMSRQAATSAQAPMFEPIRRSGPWPRASPSARPPELQYRNLRPRPPPRVAEPTPDPAGPNRPRPHCGRTLNLKWSLSPEVAELTPTVVEPIPNLVEPAPGMVDPMWPSPPAIWSSRGGCAPSKQNRGR